MFIFKLYFIENNWIEKIIEVRQTHLHLHHQIILGSLDKGGNLPPFIIPCLPMGIIRGSLGYRPSMKWQYWWRCNITKISIQGKYSHIHCHIRSPPTYKTYKYEHTQGFSYEAGYNCTSHFLILAKLPIQYTLHIMLSSHFLCCLTSAMTSVERTNTLEIIFKPLNLDKVSQNSSTFQITFQMFFDYLFWFLKAGKW